MKKVFFMAFVLCLVMISTSCTTISKTGQAAPIAYTEVIPDVIKAEFDFNLNEKKSGKASAFYLFGFMKIGGDSKYSEVKGGETKSSMFGDRVAKVKSAAIYNALKDSNADMIINPQYDTQSRSFLFGIFKSYSVTVKGYEATIKNLYQKKAD